MLSRILPVVIVCFLIHPYTASAADSVCGGKINGYYWSTTEPSAPQNCSSPLVGQKTCSATYTNLCINGVHQKVKILESCASTSCKAASTEKKIEFGVNGHPLYNGPSVFKDDKLLAIMQERGISRYRVDVPLADNTNATVASEFKTLQEKAKAKGITLKPVLLTPFAWGDRTDNGKYPKGDAKALYDQGYNRTYAFVNQFKHQVNDWELGNEINLKARDAAGNSLWGKGQTAADFDTPGMNDWAALLKGMSDAIDKINADNKLKLRKTLNTTSTMFGFLDFMSSKGITFDVISYHYYETGATNPNSYWGGPGKSNFNLFQKLASYNKPVTINELNCGEIYKSGFENKPGNSLTDSCYKSLNTLLTYFTTQKLAKIESIDLYEIVDEPKKAGAEGMFGLMYDSATPKLSLAIVAKHAGGKISPQEQTLLTSYGIR